MSFNLSRWIVVNGITEIYRMRCVLILSVRTRHNGLYQSGLVTVDCTRTCHVKRLHVKSMCYLCKVWAVCQRYVLIVKSMLYMEHSPITRRMRADYQSYGSHYLLYVSSYASPLPLICELIIRRMGDHYLLYVSSYAS